MKKKILTGLLILVLTGEGYITYDIIQENAINIPDISKIPTDSLLNPAFDSTNIYVCSFNIKFLGNYSKKDNLSLAHLLNNFDIVIIQELVAPPFNGTYPDGESFKPDKESEAFFKAMIDFGFKYILSEEDTGPQEEIHDNSAKTEWWVGFYKRGKVRPDMDLPHGFLATDRSKNPDYDRVPYAFSFRSLIDSSDFVLISVHLESDKGGMQHRKHELSEIASWIDSNDGIEKDFIILGDMNIQNKAEFTYVMPKKYFSLNTECRRTNNTINDEPNNGAKPYDHILYNPQFTEDEIDEEFNMVVLDLIKLMKPYWTSENAYPGDPNNTNLFCQYYSDHNPIIFRIKSSIDDD